MTSLWVFTTFSLVFFLLDFYLVSLVLFLPVDLFSVLPRCIIFCPLTVTQRLCEIVCLQPGGIFHLFARRFTSIRYVTCLPLPANKQQQRLMQKHWVFTPRCKDLTLIFSYLAGKAHYKWADTEWQGLGLTSDVGMNATACSLMNDRQ